MTQSDEALISEAQAIVNGGGDTVPAKLQQLLKRAKDRDAVRDQILQMRKPKQQAKRKVTPEEIVEWERDHASGISCREISLRYGRGISTIEKYVYRKPV